MNIRKIAGFGIGPACGLVLGLVTLPMLTWLYSPEIVGRLGLLQAVSGAAVMLFCLGLDQSFVREYHEVDNKIALFKVVALPGIGLLLMSLVCVFLIRPHVLSSLLFGVSSVRLSILIGCCFVALLVIRMLSLVLRMEERGLAFSMGRIVPKIVLLLIVGQYYLFSYGFDLYHLILAFTLSVAAIALTFAFAARRLLMSLAGERFDVEQLKMSLQFGAPLILGSAAFWGLTAMDKVLLRALSSFDELGVYSVAVSIAGGAAIMQQVFNVIWAPTVYRWVAEGINTERIDAVSRHLLIVVVALFCLVGLFSRLVGYVLPDEYAQVPYLLVACMSYPLFFMLSETTVVGIGVTRKTGYSLLVSALALLVNVAMGYLLVSRFGAAGAAVTTAICFWLFFVLRTEFSCKVWRKVPRARMYVLTFLCLVLSVAYVFFGPSAQHLFQGCWGALLVAVMILYRATIMRSVRSMATHRLALG